MLTFCADCYALPWYSIAVATGVVYRWSRSVFFCTWCVWTSSCFSWRDRGAGQRGSSSTYFGLASVYELVGHDIVAQECSRSSAVEFTEVDEGKHCFDGVGLPKLCQGIAETVFGVSMPVLVSASKWFAHVIVTVLCECCVG